MLTNELVLLSKDKRFLMDQLILYREKQKQMDSTNAATEDDPDIVKEKEAKLIDIVDEEETELTVDTISHCDKPGEDDQ